MAAFYKDETVWQRFCQTADTYTDQPFLRYMPSVAKVYDIAAGDITYGEMQQSATRRAAELAGAGLRRGDLHEGGRGIGGGFVIGAHRLSAMGPVWGWYRAGPVMAAILLFAKRCRSLEAGFTGRYSPFW